MRWLPIAALLACGCPSKSPQPTVGTGSGGSASSAQATGTSCDAMRSKVEQLYRAEAGDQPPARLDELVADNTSMVMNDCIKSPDKTAACIAAATTVQELQRRCLVPLDDEGTEGDRLTH